MTESLSFKDRMFQRLANILKDRFDVVVTFTDFSTRLRVADAKTIGVVQRNPTSRIIVMGNDLILALRHGDTLFGYLTVFDGLRLKDDQIEQAIDLSEMLLTESCVLEDKAHKMKLLEFYLQQRYSLEEVLDLKKRVDEENVRYIEPEISVHHEALDKVFPILIESMTEADAKEFALELHRNSERSSFLTYESYLSTELLTVQKIKELGPVTLFIPSLREVPLDIQIQLANFLSAESRTALHPRVVASVQENPELLVQVGLLDVPLLQKLSVARVKLPPKGTSSMTIEEILGFFAPQKPPVQRHLFLVTEQPPSLN